MNNLEIINTYIIITEKLVFDIFFSLRILPYFSWYVSRNFNSKNVYDFSINKNCFIFPYNYVIGDIFNFCLIQVKQVLTSCKLLKEVIFSFVNEALQKGRGNNGLLQTMKKDHLMLKDFVKGKCYLI